MNHEGPDHVMALLGYAMDGFRRELVQRMRATAPEGRAALRPTPAGLEAVAAGERVIAEDEAEWRRRVGADRWDLLRDILGDVARLPRSSEGHPAS